MKDCDMEGCSPKKTGHPSVHCARCGAPGQPVPRQTVAFHVLGAYQREIRDTDYYFLAPPDCPVVYFSKDNDHFISKDQLRHRVGTKETEDPRPLCYCFGFERKDLAIEIERTGQTNIPEFIRQKVQRGECACEIMNPSGRCCLGQVRATLKELRP